MLRRILLLICLAFVVVIYAFPCFVLPFGTYKATYTDPITEEKETECWKFGFDKTIKDEDGNLVYYYRLKGDKIELANDEEFSSTKEISLSNAYTFDVDFVLYQLKFVNSIGIWASVGIGVLALVCIITIPNRKK